MSGGKQTIGGIDVIDEGDVTHFKVSDEVIANEEKKRHDDIEHKAKEPSSWFGKVINWLIKSPIRPYVAVKNPHEGSSISGYSTDEGHGATGIEIGIKGEF